MARPRLISDQDIVAEVRRAVAEAGARFSLDVVAERLGVTSPALFKRFGSRDALLIAALRPDRPPFLDVLEAGPDERPLAVQLVDLFERIGNWFAEVMPRIMALHESGIPMCQVHAAVEEAPPVVIIRTMTRWLTKAQAAGLLSVPDPQAAAMAMLGALQQRTLLNHFLNRTTAAKRDLRNDAQRLAALFIQGVAPVRASRPRTARTHLKRVRA